MLVGNVFTKFADLLFTIGRIEDGIRRGRIANTGTSILKKKGIIFDEQVQTMSMERENKRKSYMMIDEPINNLFHTSPHTPVHWNQGPLTPNDYSRIWQRDRFKQIGRAHV